MLKPVMALLAVISILAIILGLINPRFVLIGSSPEKKTRGKVLAVYLILFSISFISLSESFIDAIEDLFTLFFLYSCLGIIISLFKPQCIIRWGPIEKRTRFKAFSFSMIFSLITLITSIQVDNSFVTEADIQQKKEQEIIAAKAKKQVDQENQKNETEQSPKKSSLDATPVTNLSPQVANNSKETTLGEPEKLQAEYLIYSTPQDFVERFNEKSMEIDAELNKNGYKPNHVRASYIYDPNTRKFSVTFSGSGNILSNFQISGTTDNQGNIRYMSMAIENYLNTDQSQRYIIFSSIVRTLNPKQEFEGSVDPILNAIKKGESTVGDVKISMPYPSFPILRFAHKDDKLVPSEVEYIKN